jgi:hypothetical protein
MKEKKNDKIFMGFTIALRSKGKSVIKEREKI